MKIKWKLAALFVVLRGFALLLTMSICPYPSDCGWQLWLK